MDLNFGDLFDAVAKAVPSRTAIVYGDKTYSWSQLDERSNRLARKLIDLGLRPDSKVAFYLWNSPAYVDLLAACFKARLVHVNVNYRYVDKELHYIFDNADAQAIVFDSEFAPHVENLRSRLPKVQAFVEVGPVEGSARALSFERACADGDGAPLDLKRSGCGCSRRLSYCVALVGDAFSVPMIEAFFRNATARDSLGSSEGSRLAGSETKQGESGATGRFKLGPDAKVFTEDLREVEPGSGEAGMIATTGPIPLGYYKVPARTRKTFPEINGVRYSVPGDWCTVEADGTSNLLGRGSNCINVSN